MGQAVQLISVFGSPFLLKYARHAEGQFAATTIANVSRDSPVSLIAQADVAQEIDVFVPEILDNPRLVEILRAGAPLIMDGSGEGPGFSPQIFLRLHARLGTAGLDARRIIFLTQNRAYANAYASWCIANKIEQRINIFEYHYHMREFARGARRLTDLTSAVVDKRAEQMVSDVAGLKKYICLNNKVRDHRVVVLGRIARLGLLDDGYVSMLVGDAELARFRPDNVMEQALQRFPKFRDDVMAFEALSNGGALRIPGDNLKKNKAVDFDGQLHLHATSCFSIVNETEMSAGQIRRFTEKSLKPLAGGQPFFVLGNPGVLEMLRFYGFETFTPFIDESYDFVSDPQDRLFLSMEEVIRHISGDMPTLRRTLSDLRDVLRANVGNFETRLPIMLAKEDHRLAILLNEIWARG